MNNAILFEQVRNAYEKAIATFSADDEDSYDLLWTPDDELKSDFTDYFCELYSTDYYFKNCDEIYGYYKIINERKNKNENF